MLGLYKNRAFCVIQSSSAVFHIRQQVTLSHTHLVPHTDPLDFGRRDWTMTALSSGPAWPGPGQFILLQLTLYVFPTIFQVNSTYFIIYGAKLINRLHQGLSEFQEAFDFEISFWPGTTRRAVSRGPESMFWSVRGARDRQWGEEAEKQRVQHYNSLPPCLFV